MEISVKKLSIQKTLNGLVKNITALRKIVVEISLQNALPCKMFAYGMPYEATKTYRTIRNEFENTKSLATIETRQAICRC